jgi:hypothetical protein
MGLIWDRIGPADAFAIAAVVTIAGLILLLARLKWRRSPAAE